MRMDTPSLMKAASDGIGSGGVAPNEARKRWLNLGPVTGGDTPYLQEQNYSLQALDKRDSLADPFAHKNPQAPQTQATATGAQSPAPSDDEPVTDERAAVAWRKALAA